MSAYINLRTLISKLMKHPSITLLKLLFEQYIQIIWNWLKPKKALKAAKFSQCHAILKKIFFFKLIIMALILSLLCVCLCQIKWLKASFSSPKLSFICEWFQKHTRVSHTHTQWHTRRDEKRKSKTTFDNAAMQKRAPAASSERMHHA